MVIVDFAGYPHNLERFRRIADRYGLWIIEDACHAPGAWFTASDGSHQRQRKRQMGRLLGVLLPSCGSISPREKAAWLPPTTLSCWSVSACSALHGITRDPALLERNDGGWYYEMQELGLITVSPIFRRHSAYRSFRVLPRVWRADRRDCTALRRGICRTY